MMKKLLFGVMATAMFFATSCDRSFDEGGVAAGGAAKVSVNLEFPTMQTRAYSTGTTATTLQYAVFEKKDGNIALLNDYTTTDTEFSLKKEIDFRLITGRTYAFVFWAAAPDAPYTVKFANNGATMTVDYTNITANNESLDAFYAYKELEVKGDCQMSAELYRPFAQINVGTNDYAAAETAGYEPTESHMTISKVYSELNLVNGTVDTETKVDFKYAAIPSNETFPTVGDGKTKYDYMAMVYALVSAEQEVVEVSFDCKDAAEEVRAKYTVGSVPVQRNHRTNIYGQLLTSNAKVIVEIVPEYEEPNYEVIAVADGVVYDEATDTFTVSSPAGLQWVAAQVNGHGGSSYVETNKYVYGGAQVAFEGQTIELAGDLDMQDVEWTPIGYETKENGASIYAFAGTFDGKEFTISNLTVTTEKNSNAGLFGATNYATIKNLTLKDVNINGHYKTAAFVADAWCTTVDNCHVTGGTVTSTPWEIKPNVYDDANNVGGIVGYLCGQPDAAAVTNCTVDGVAITAFRKIGGIVGVASFRKDNYGEPSATITGCTVSNTTITADMTEMRYDGYVTRQAAIGEIVGEAQEGTTMDNNTSSENVTLETKKATIAGASEAVAAMTGGGNVFITEDVTITARIAMARAAVVNFGGKTITNETAGADAIQLGGGDFTFMNGKIDNSVGGGETAGIYANSSKGNNITIDNMEITATYPIYLNNAVNPECVIKSGTFTSPYDNGVAVYVQRGGHAVIEGGFFTTDGHDSTYLLNLQDDLVKGKPDVDPRTFIEVKGGTFVNFDPSASMGEPAPWSPCNFVADGYKVVVTKVGNDTHYTVVAE